MMSHLWLYGTVAGLGAVSALSMLLHSRRSLTWRTLFSTTLTGALTSFMTVAWWYGAEATNNPWPAWAVSTAIGLSQPKGHELAARLRRVLWAVVAEIMKGQPNDHE